MAQPHGIPLVAGKYALVRELGVGGSATVFEAEHALVGKPVALKLLHPELRSRPQIVERFLAEARAAATVRHDNVVDIHDVGVDDDGSAYMVMELLRGETLAEILAARGPLPFPYACELMLQVLAALAAAHAQGIVHRDLKPSNVMVTHPHPDRPRVKVLDFGIAKGVLSRAHDQPPDGALLGTPVYMAPEQMLGRDVDARADIYAAGVMLYELVGGVRPAGGASPMELLRAVLQGDHTPIGELCPELPDALGDAIESALSVSADMRPPSASLLAQQLAPFVERQHQPSLAASMGASLEPIPLVDGKRRVVSLHVNSFPAEGTLHIEVPVVALPEWQLFDPQFPRAPSTPELDAESLGLPPGTPVPAGPELIERRAPTLPPKPRLRLDDAAPWVALASGFGAGLALAWLSGVL